MVTAIYETNNCRTFLTASSHEGLAFKLSNIKRTNKDSFKLISIHSGSGLKSSNRLVVG